MFMSKYLKLPLEQIMKQIMQKLFNFTFKGIVSDQCNNYMGDDLDSLVENPPFCNYVFQLLFNYTYSCIFLYSWEIVFAITNQ